jgi:hypothetical protein|tara:strand:+ start:652 stop:939 length:288 start_codon:yes stop_codon:yes gene_type:complete
MFGKAFKPRKYYVFDYKPRYYSERKERLDALQKEHDSCDTLKDGIGIRLTKNNLRTNWVKNTKISSNRSTNRRLAIIVTILVGVVAYLFELHKLI